ncbi:hypothetical protein ACLMAJ_27700 [Nocardia sp. KC 131]|uniref:hypothetical protein n=1 Tax=Nocardia arseniciresistens TaxID=3392119 RepID=UPI00398E6BBB
MLHDLVARLDRCQPGRAPVCAIESLADLGWDMTPAAQALPVIDAAVARFNDDPETLRPLAVGDRLGRRRYAGPPPASGQGDDQLPGRT